MRNEKAEKIFKHHKGKVEASLNLYNHLKNNFIMWDFPMLTARIWREGMLAEVWGTIATILNKQGINYLDEWRQGR